MVSKIEPDRYADTGLAVKDTPAEVNARLFAAMMRKSPEERLLMCLDMMATARILMRRGIERECGSMTELERKRLAFQRIHGVPCPW
jgi:hypothetical protein